LQVLWGSGLTWSDFQKNVPIKQKPKVDIKDKIMEYKKN